MTLSSHPSEAPPDTRTDSRLGLITLIAALVPATAAVWGFSTFVTQDGPSHLYNAHVLTRSLDSAAPFRDVFSVRWQPLPNWAGHLSLMGLLKILPARDADRVMTTTTLLAVALAGFRLRRRVAGSKGLPAAALLAALMAMNESWLFGFTSFLLGAALFPVTLGYWWASREASHPSRRAAGLAALAILGYFCHLVSLGLTALGLIVLETFTPGPRRSVRAATTLAGLLPLGPLGWLYLGLMRAGGGALRPQWKHLENLGSARAWGKQLSWVDPISISRRDVLPFLEGQTSRWFTFGTPVVWLLAALLVLVAIAVRQGLDRERRGWWVLALILIFGGIASPDTLGPTHGEYLQQRIVLLGLVALIPVLPFDSRRSGLATVLLAGAVALQSALVCEYGLVSNRTAGKIARVSSSLGSASRVIFMLSGIRSRFEANPLLHADGLLGVGSDRILWNDYETRYYYFPVHFRDGLDHPDTIELENIALSESPDRVERWARLLERYHAITDIVVSWGNDSRMDEVTGRWFRVVYEDGPARVYQAN